MSDLGTAGERWQSSAHRDTSALMRYDANKKSAGVAYAFWFFLGSCGAHRFYLKRGGTAATMLLTFVLSLLLTTAGIGLLGLVVVGVWALVDAFLIPGMARDCNNKLINQLSM